MLPDFVDLDSSQAQAIERSYRSSLKRELVKRGIQVVDEGFTENAETERSQPVSPR